MKKEMVGEVPGNILGMVADLAHKLQCGSISPAELGLFLKRQNPFSVPENTDTPQLLTAWQSFYHNFFGMDGLDFSSVPIPNRKPGFDRLIIVAQGLTPNQVYEACAQHFPCWRYTDDLDAATQGLNDRDPKDGHYAIWVRDRQEADEELKNLSANQIKEKGLKTETLLERMLHELKYWSETNKHLDRDNITLCSGSRDRNGSVPNASWSRDRFRVDWYGPGDSVGSLRARAVVS